MRQQLKEWAPVASMLLTGAALLLTQGSNVGRIERGIDAVQHDIAVLRAELQYDVSDLRQRVHALETRAAAATRPTLAVPAILWKDVYADTTKRTKVPRPPRSTANH